MMHWFTPAWIVQTLIASALLMALVMAVRAPVMRLFGAKVAYALWLLPALRMVLPPLPGHRSLVIPVAAIEPNQATVATTTLPPSAPELAVHYAPIDPPPLELHVAPMPAALPAHPVDWAMLLLAVWLAGAALFFGVQLVRYQLFLRRALKNSFRLSRDRGIDVLVSDGVSGPIAAGIFKRRILLPGNFVGRYSPEERRLALAHEAAHHDRLDIPANLAALGIVALHWWNPLAHRAHRAFRADQELACDATVLRGAAPEERHSYGSAMLKSVSGRMPAMACALSHKDQLRKRILMMAHSRFGRLRLITGAALTATAIGGGLLVTATGEAQTAQKPARIETVAVPPSVPVPPVPVAKAGPAAPAAPAAPVAMASRPASPVPPVRLATADRKAADCARSDAEQAREAGREAAEAGREAARAAREAGREAAEEARDAAAGRRADARVRASLSNTAELVRASMESARAGLHAACDAQGVTMPADAAMGALATCGGRPRQIVLASLQDARDEITRDPSIPADARRKALAGIDVALARNR